MHFRYAACYSKPSEECSAFLKKTICKGIAKPVRILKNGLDREALLSRGNILRADKGLMNALSHATDELCKRLSRHLYAVSLPKIVNCAPKTDNSKDHSPRITGKEVDLALQNMGHTCLFAEVAG